VRPSPARPPLSLAQICRDWREIALSSSEFWSSVDLSFPLFRNGQLYESPNEGAFPLLEKWFARAKARPLSVTIRSSHEKIPRPIISLISTVTAQIQSLELNLSHKDFRFLRQNSLAFPSLRHLAIIANDGPSNYLSIFKNALSLLALGICHEPGSVSTLYPLLASIDFASGVLPHWQPLGVYSGRPPALASHSDRGHSIHTFGQPTHNSAASKIADSP
jgi:hypothetical protein